MRCSISPFDAAEGPEGKDGPARTQAQALYKRKPCYWVVAEEPGAPAPPEDEPALDVEGGVQCAVDEPMLRRSTTFRVTDLQLLADFVFFETSGLDLLSYAPPRLLPFVVPLLSLFPTLPHRGRPFVFDSHGSLKRPQPSGMRLW